MTHLNQKQNQKQKVKTNLIILSINNIINKCRYYLLFLGNLQTLVDYFGFLHFLYRKFFFLHIYVYIHHQILMELSTV